MKFELDTKAKTLKLLEPIRFKELDALKKFIGEEWKDWTISMRVETKIEREIIRHHDNWPWYPYHGPIWTTAGSDDSLPEPNVTIYCDHENGLQGSSFLVSTDSSTLAQMSIKQLTS